MRKTAVPQEQPQPQTSASGCPGTGQIGLRRDEAQGVLAAPAGFQHALHGAEQPCEGARPPTRATGASQPAPPDTTRVTQACSAPRLLAHGHRVCVSVTGSSPSSRRPPGWSVRPRGVRSQGTWQRPHAKTRATDGPRRDDRTGEPMARTVGARCARWPRVRAHRSCAGRAPWGGPAPEPSRPSGG
jgi:hypothetical protein